MKEWCLSTDTCWCVDFGVRFSSSSNLILPVLCHYRLKLPTCCSISAETKKAPPNLNLRRHWEEPRSQPMTTWTQIKKPQWKGTHTETHMANRDTRTHTQSYFSGRGFRRRKTINPTFPVFWFVSYVVSYSQQPWHKSELWDFPPCSGWSADFLK